MSDFEAFWAAYPSKVGRIAAEHEYMRARKRASAQKILEGVTRYVENKPAWKEWCNPKTFLHEGRWMDEYDAPAAVEKMPKDFDWYVECMRLHGGECGGDRMRHHIRMGTERWKEQAS